jgi:hypothetical protein
LNSNSADVGWVACCSQPNTKASTRLAVSTVYQAGNFANEWGIAPLQLDEGIGQE